MRNPPAPYKGSDPTHTAFSESADSSLLAKKQNYASGGPVEFAHHEQSETEEIPGTGEWRNVYGGTTPQTGQGIQLPDTPVYPTQDEAVEAAKKRSEDYGAEHPEEDKE